MPTAPYAKPEPLISTQDAQLSSFAVCLPCAYCPPHASFSAWCFCASFAPPALFHTPLLAVCPWPIGSPACPSPAPSPIVIFTPPLPFFLPPPAAGPAALLLPAASVPCCEVPALLLTPVLALVLLFVAVVREGPGDEGTALAALRVVFVRVLALLVVGVLERSGGKASAGAPGRPPPHTSHRVLSGALVSVQRGHDQLARCAAAAAAAAASSGGTHPARGCCAAGLSRYAVCAAISASRRSATGHSAASSGTSANNPKSTTCEW